MGTAGLSRRATGGKVRITGLVAGGLGLAMTLAAASPVSHESITNRVGTLLSVSAVSRTDAWSVGGSGNTEPMMLHWNGTTWTRTALSGKGSPGLGAVGADSPDDAWAVGSINGPHGTFDNLALHWNGTAWAKA